MILVQRGGVARGQLGHWRSRTTFVLALSSAAVGLGSLWRFAYLMGEYGGGAFFISYILSLYLLAIPLLVAELAVGAHGRASPLLALRWASDRSLLYRYWMWLGLLACGTGIVIVSYYVVVAGWSLSYMRDMQSGQFSAASVQQLADHFADLLADAERQYYWQSVFLALLVAIVALGLRRGLGTLVWLAVPSIITLLGMLVMFSLDHGDLSATRDYLFRVKWVDFSVESILAAMGHALLTLGVGAGIGISYGAYTHERVPIGRSVMAVAVFDTVIALLAGLAIFPMLFANNLDPAAGPGLFFIGMPYVFGNIGQGEIFGSAFFLLIAVVSLASCAAFMEPSVGAVTQHLRVRRPVAVLIVGAVVWVLAYAVAGSLQEELWLGGPNLMALFDTVATGFLLPLVSLGMAVFVGWRMRPEILRVQLGRESDVFFSLWRGLLRYIAPLVLGLLMLIAYSQLGELV